MSDILVSEVITGPALTSLQHEFDLEYAPELWENPSELAEKMSNIRALIVRNQTPVTADLIAQSPRLKVIGRAGVGLDNIDVSAAVAAGVVVASTPHQNAVSVAELTIGLVLALARRIPAADRDTKSGGWDRKAWTGIELHGKTMGVVGFGRIGFLTAMRANAFGMHVVAYDPYVAVDSVLVSQANVHMIQLEKLLEQSDIVCCHLPSSSETEGLFNASRFGLMKSSALFVNISRGDVIDESALVHALQTHQIAGAALDVRYCEPPEPNAFSKMDQVILTPHIGAFTQEAQERVVTAICRDVAAVLNGQPAANAVRYV